MRHCSDEYSGRHEARAELVHAARVRHVLERIGTGGALLKADDYSSVVALCDACDDASCATQQFVLTFASACKGATCPV